MKSSPNHFPEPGKETSRKQVKKKTNWKAKVMRFWLPKRKQQQTIFPEKTTKVSLRKQKPVLKKRNLSTQKFRLHNKPSKREQNLVK